MSLREVVIRAGESGGRKATVRQVLPNPNQELLPSQIPLNKPTRDVSASNRSHSLAREDPPIFHSDRRILLLEREAEEIQYQKQANIVYNRQFRSLAKLLGNEAMEFDELRHKIEGLILQEMSTVDPVISQRIQNLERELTKRNMAAEVGRSTQSLPSSNDYLRGLENELGRKSKMISQLSDSIKRQAFEEAFRNLQAEVEAKGTQLKLADQRVQQARLKAANSISQLEQELIRNKQTIQKLTFELDTQKRRSQNSIQDIERLRRREKELVATFQSESKAVYQGISYSAHALLLQLEAKDEQLMISLNEQQTLRQELHEMKQQKMNNQALIVKSSQQTQLLSQRLRIEETQRQKFIEEIERVTQELHNSHAIIVSANSQHQIMQAEKQKFEATLESMSMQLQESQKIQKQLRMDHHNYEKRIAELEEVVQNLNIHIRQAREQVISKEQEVITFSVRLKAVENELGIKEKKIIEEEEKLERKVREFIELSNHLTLREEEFTNQVDSLSAKYNRKIDEMRETLDLEKTQTNKYSQQLIEANERNSQLQNENQHLNENLVVNQNFLSKSNMEIKIMEERIEAFQRQKDLLMQKLQETEKECERYINQCRQTEEIASHRTELQYELQSRKRTELQLRAILQEEGSKLAHIEAEMSQKDAYFREFQEQIQRQKMISQEDITHLRNTIAEMQQQFGKQKYDQQTRMEEFEVLKYELEGEITNLRQAINELETKNHQEIHLRNELEKQSKEKLQKAYNEFDLAQEERQKLVAELQLLKQNQQYLQNHIDILNQEIMKFKQKENELILTYSREKEATRQEIRELLEANQSLRAENAGLEEQLQSIRRSRDNELASFSFNHFEGQQAESPEMLRGIIEELELKLENYQREQQKIRLSYSQTQQISLTAIFGTLQSENELLQQEKIRLLQQIESIRTESYRIQSQGTANIQNLTVRLKQYELHLRERENELMEFHKEANSEKTSANEALKLLKAQHQAQYNHYQLCIKQKEDEIMIIHNSHNDQVIKVHSLTEQVKKLQTKLQQIKIKQNHQINSLVQESHRLKEQLNASTSEMLRLQVQIRQAYRELEASQLQALNQRSTIKQLQEKILFLQSRVAQLEQKERKVSREQFQALNRRLSGVSKSDLTQKQLEDNRSKVAYSDGELSRNILNDPSKISGQQSKFAHHLLIFDNSKIHVVKQTIQSDPKEQQREIKEQRQQQSVLSKQQIQNRTPQSSNRQINTTNFDRFSNQNSRKEIKQPHVNINQSQRSEEIIPANNIKRSKGNSFETIKQGIQMKEDNSHISANRSQISENGKQVQKPKEYLPQQSSKKTISNPNQSKHNISSQKQSQKYLFQRASDRIQVPIYIARPSHLIHQERPKEQSQSRSGSKTKVRISYGQPSERSIELKRRQVTRQMAGSQILRVSQASNKTNIKHSINQISPVQPIPSARNSQTHQSLFSSQRRQNMQSRQSVQTGQNDQPSESIINGINHLGSRISMHGHNRFTNISSEGQRIEPPPARQQTFPLVIQPRIDSAYSPRHSNTSPQISFASPGSSGFKPLFRATEKPKNLSTVRQETKKDELSVPAGKIIMRSVIGGKRNSLLNDTATFGKRSQKGAIDNDLFSESNDSGIDVLQADWTAPCCKNEP